MTPPDSGDGGTGRAVDIHQHLWPASFVAALRRRRAAPFLDGDLLVTREGRFATDLAGHDPAARIRGLDALGLDLAVLSLQPSLGLDDLPDEERDALETAWIEGAAEVVAGSGGRLAALAPGRVVDGFVGVSVGAGELVADLDAAGSGGSRALAEADAAGALVFVHPEAGHQPPADGRPDWWNWMIDYPGQMQAAYLAWLAGGRARRPQLRVVFALLAGGAPFQHERLAHRGADLRSLLDPDVYFETASYGRRAIELCIETFGVENLLYGSDVPVIDPGPTLAAVQGFGDAVTRFLTVENPARLIAGTAPEGGPR
jgi:6-methylsalicylate decarboxylase